MIDATVLKGSASGLAKVGTHFGNFTAGVDDAVGHCRDFPISSSGPRRQESKAAPANIDNCNDFAFQRHHRLHVLADSLFRADIETRRYLEAYSPSDALRGRVLAAGKAAPSLLTDRGEIG